MSEEKVEDENDVMMMRPSSPAKVPKESVSIADKSRIDFTSGL